MPFWMHIIIGMSVLVLGGGLMWLAFWQTPERQSTGLEVAPAEAKGLSRNHHQVTEAGSGPLKTLHAAKMGYMGTHTDSISGLRLEIYEHGPVKMSSWAGKIANNIYIRAGKIQDAHVEEVLKPALKGQYQDIDALDALHPMGWIQVVVHPGLLDSLRQDQGLGLTDLSEKLRSLVLESLGICLTPAIHNQYQPHLVICEDDSLGTTSFNLRFQPLPPATSAQALDCQAAIGLKPIGAISTVPGLEETHLRVADKNLDGRAYAPLSERFAEKLVLGPKSWCHLRTTPETFNSVVTLGWRPSHDRRSAGQLQVLDVKGNDPLLLELPGYAQKQVCKKGWYIEIPAEEGPHTMAYFWTQKNGLEENIGAIFVANPMPDIGSLPEVVVLDHLEHKLNTANDFARFIATQIYLASKRKHRHANLAFLDDEDGFDYMNHHGLAFERELRPEALLTNNDPLHYRIKMVLAPPQYKLMKELFGKIATRQSVHDLVMKLLKEQAPYRQMFGEVRSMLLPDERKPGLSIDISLDNLIPRGTVLLRLLPLLENVRRREIFGEIRLDQMPGARDISGMSCNGRRNFLIEYPAGNIMMRLSRYPLYGIHAPQIAGFIGLSLEDPESPSARLFIENGSNSELKVTAWDADTIDPSHSPATQSLQTRRLPPDQEMAVPIPVGINHRIEVASEQQSFEIQIYPEPLPQMNEPEFVPAPGKLEFYGLTLARRQEVSQWQNSNFSPLWHSQTQSEDLGLEGVSRMTRHGYLASVIRDETMREVHYFCEKPATLQEGLAPLKLPAASSTVSSGGLSTSAQIYENEAPGQVTQYERVALDQVKHAKVLLKDYFDHYYDAVAQYLPSQERLLAIDLLKCNSGDISNLDLHLYAVKTKSEQTQMERGWIFCVAGGIQRIGSGPGQQTIALDFSKPLVGPLDLKRFYTVDWPGGLRTPLSFAIENHTDQISRYLEDGWFELRKDMVFAPGGNLAAEPKPFSGRDPQFIVTNQLKLTHNTQTVHTANQLNFDPRELCNFFDKDAFRLGYLPDAKAFTLRSMLHPNMGTTPKTVFMIVPSGEQAILGSHALDHVDIPPGRNILVLPGLAFRFSQGPAYYGVTV